MPEVEKDEMEGEIEGKEAGSKDKDRKHDSGAADLEKVSLLLLLELLGGQREIIIRLYKVLKCRKLTFYLWKKPFSFDET